MPALLMLPLVLFYHTGANQAWLSSALVAVGAGACWRFARRLALQPSQAAFLVAVLLFATSYFCGGMRGDVWQLANVSALTFTLLLLDEVAGANRPWLVAIFAVAAGFSRYTLLPLVIAYGLFGARAFGWSYVRPYYFVVERALVAFAAYNVVRWGTLYDQGYKLYETIDTHRQQPMFALQYFPGQVGYMFLTPLHPTASFPFLVPDDLGFGIVFSGAVFFWALFAPRCRATVALWILTALAALPNLLYYDNGDEQFGIRHEMDFAPFLIGLLAFTLRAHRSRFVYYVGYVNVACGIVWLAAFLNRYSH